MCVCMCILLTYNLAFSFYIYMRAVVGVYWHRKLVNTHFILPYMKVNRCQIHYKLKTRPVKLSLEMM